jgi:superkiller protein 3
MAQHGWCRALAMLGDYRTGIAHCASATRLNALDLGAWLDWGDALLRMGDYAGAIDKYQRALALDAGASQAHSGLGLALLDQGKAVEALRHLDMDFARSGQAVSGYPAFRDAMLAGHYDMYQGSEGDIIINQQLEAPVISQPGTPWFYLQQGDSFAGRAMGLGPSTERDWLAAINQYKQAIAVNANFSQAYREWAVALAGMGKPRRAEEKIELAIRANPFCADCYATWGYILMQRGDLASAAHKLQQAIALRPILVSARIALGNTLERLGRIDEARITYQDILVLSPGSPVAADRLRQLSAIPGSGR